MGAPHRRRSTTSSCSVRPRTCPKTRRRVERECLELWSRHGFRVFDWYDDVEVIAPDCPPGGYLLCGYVDAPTLEDHLLDASLPLEQRFATYRRFLKEWCRRHDIASAEREPRLMHENGDFGHVMLVGDEFLWFDLEMVYRSRSRVDEYLGHEIIQYLWYLSRKSSPEVRDRLLPGDRRALSEPRAARRRARRLPPSPAPVDPPRPQARRDARQRAEADQQVQRRAAAARRGGAQPRDEAQAARAARSPAVARSVDPRPRAQDDARGLSRAGSRRSFGRRSCSTRCPTFSVRAACAISRR